MPAIRKSVRSLTIAEHEDGMFVVSYEQGESVWPHETFKTRQGAISRMAMLLGVSGAAAGMNGIVGLSGESKTEWDEHQG